MSFAEQHRLQPDFTFKRESVPKAGTTRRITVQISPKAPTGAASPYAPSVAGTVQTSAPQQSGAIPGATPQASELSWFWTAVSPERDASVPGRLLLALDVLNKAPDGQDVVEPRLASMQQIASNYGRDILMATIGTRVSPALALSVIAVESAGDPNAISRVGAQGLMQLMPDTATRFGVTNALDPAQNIRGGVAYLDWLMNEFDNDPVLFLAAYNAGEGTIRDKNGVPNYPETRAYVPKVLAAWNVARALCQTPPELMSDGCAFSVPGE